MYHDHRQSVSIAGDGIEIGRLQIHLDEKRTSHIKSQILEARLDESASLADTGSKYYKNYQNKLCLCVESCSKSRSKYK